MDKVVLKRQCRYMVFAARLAAQVVFVILGTACES